MGHKQGLCVLGIDKQVSLHQCLQKITPGLRKIFRQKNYHTNYTLMVVYQLSANAVYISRNAQFLDLILVSFTVLQTLRLGLLQSCNETSKCGYILQLP